jgi:hypothetical protein
MISFINIKNTVNTGDMACTPYHYFSFPRARSFHLSDKIPPCDAAIFGGGAIEPQLRNEGLHRKIVAKYKIAWGIGTSRSGTKDHGPLVDDLDLCGVREYEREGGIYVPCVSCMSPLFDLPYKVLYEFVLYSHAAKPIPGPKIEGIPELNNRAPLDAALAFIASGETVITNSYHGAYWATLLGKKVICIPFSSKFYGYKFPPIYSNAKDWLQDSKKAVYHPEALDDCRHENHKFYQQVLNLIM